MTIKVSLFELINTAEELFALNMQFQKCVENLESVEARLMTMWEGEARLVFDKQFQNDLKKMRTFFTLVTVYSEALNLIAEVYRMADEAEDGIVNITGFAKQELEALLAQIQKLWGDFENLVTATSQEVKSELVNGYKHYSGVVHDFMDDLSEHPFKTLLETYKDLETLYIMDLLKIPNILPLSPSFLYTLLYEKENRQAWETYIKNHSADKYIEDQNSMKDIYFGFDISAVLPFGIGEWINNKTVHADNLRAAGNACEVIAAYNALIALGIADPVDVMNSSLANGSGVNDEFLKMLNHFETNGVVLEGNFGTSPYDINNYLNSISGVSSEIRTGQSINVEKTTDAAGNTIYNGGSAFDDMKNYDTYILTSWNNPKDPTAGIHTVSVTKDITGYDANGYPQYGYTIHNDGFTKGQTFSSLEEAVSKFGNDNDPVSLIGVKND